ncbi:MAG: sugar-binding protein [Verrucomicrobia bacterium]|nr:sugar-binding protein [Verrucomicrobiota bacterium]
MNRLKFPLSLCAVIAFGILFFATIAPAADKKKIVYVTNGVDPFWNVAAAGVRAAGIDFKVETEVLMPPKGIVDQKRMIETALVRGVDGIAISPIDAKNQVDLINEAASQTKIITHDSDAPGSKRLCFVGMDNYKAGRAAGELVKQALPGGGKIMIFVGRLEQLNAQQRRQGVIDEVLDRPMQSPDKIKYDAANAELKNAKYNIVSTRTDNFDFAKAKSNAEDAMAAHSDLACMVGLFAYNMPNCLTAVKEAGKLGKIKLVSFDEADATLQGITDGFVHGTVSQQPYKYGYESIRILAGLARGDKSVLPPDGFFEVKTIIVRKENVGSFWQELKRLRGN